MPEKNLEDFFKVETKEKPSRVHTRSERERKNTFKESGFLNAARHFFTDRFSFDANVILTDKCSVLHRRNVVIKNIIFLANLVFTAFSFIGIRGNGFSANLIITIVFWLLMTGLSVTIATMLKKRKDDYSRQKIIMYFQSLYVFLLSVILYVKIWLTFALSIPEGESLPTNEYSIIQAAYLLIYVSILIISLYQRPRLLRTLFPWILIFMTVLHLTALHPDLYNHGYNINELIKYMFVDEKSIVVDIALRFVVLLVYFAGLYSSVIISEYIAQQRRSEFTKRVDVESNFVDVVKSVFEAVKVYNSNANEVVQAISARKVSNVAKELAIAMNYDQKTIADIVDYAKVHSEKMKLLSLDDNEFSDENFDDIMKKTELATRIIKRLQLVKRSEDILDAVFTNQVTSDFKYNMTTTLNDKISQIIVISEIYVALRSDRANHKALNHIRAVELISNGFDIFFTPDLVLRFNKFNREIGIAYDK